MSTYHPNIGSQSIRSSMRFIYDPGDLEKRRVDWELERQYEPKSDPEKPPPREHRDRYILIGAVVGIIVGGILGCILSLFVGFVVTDCIVGILAGGIAGVITGSTIRTHMLNKED